MEKVVVTDKDSITVRQNGRDDIQDLNLSHGGTHLVKEVICEYMEHDGEYSDFEPNLTLIEAQYLALFMEGRWGLIAARKGKRILLAVSVLGKVVEKEPGKRKSDAWLQDERACCEVNLVEIKE